MNERTATAIYPVLVAMSDAERKHGRNYIGNMPAGPNKERTVVLKMASNAAATARHFCDAYGHEAGRFSVLMEEVGEVADAILAGDEEATRKELAHVAAMALGWLGVEYQAVHDDLLLASEIHGKEVQQ